MLVLKVSSAPDKDVREDSQAMTMRLRFLTRHTAIKNFSYEAASADLQQQAQSIMRAGAPPVSTWRIQFDSDSCLSEGLHERYGPVTNDYSKEIRDIMHILNAIDAHEGTTHLELFFLYKQAEKSFTDSILEPFKWCVIQNLPQFFQYRHAHSGRPIMDLNMENAAEVGQGVYIDRNTNPDNVQSFPAVDVVNNEDHYAISTVVGAARENQFQGVPGQVLSQIHHKCYVVEPYATKGLQNDLFQAYIMLNEEVVGKFDHIQEGTVFRLEMVGKQEKPQHMWTGMVVFHTPEELNRYDCGFDFVLFIQKGTHGLMPDMVFDNFEHMAQDLETGYQMVRLHTAHNQTAVARPIRALKLFLESQSAFKDAMLGYGVPRKGTADLYNQVDNKNAKFAEAGAKLCAHWHLNHGQGRAAKHAMKNSLILIEGPPGTGKTVTISAIIWLSVIAGDRVLACAASNKAVDTVALNIAKNIPLGFYPDLKSFSIVRIHLASEEKSHLPDLALQAEMKRLSIAIMEIEASKQVRDDPDDKEAAKVHRARTLKVNHFSPPQYSLAQAVVALATEDYSNYQAGRDITNPSSEFRRIIGLYNDGQLISRNDQKRFRFEYKLMVRRVLDRTHIVISTCNNAASDDLVRWYHPDIIVIDEAAQAAEVDTIVPIGHNLTAKRIVLVGDHKQLAPTVLSKEFNEFSLQRARSTYERLRNCRYESILLTEQFRATAIIARFYSENFYDGQLTTSPHFQGDGKTQLVRDWAKRRYGVDTSEAIFVDVPNGVQDRQEGGSSLENRAEALVVVKILCTLLVDNPDLASTKLKAADIGVIVLYKAQKTRIMEELQWQTATITKDVRILDLETTEVSTIDSYQGSERPIIIVNFVITNINSKDQRGPSRFAIDDRRLCVMMSRARYGLILVGNAEALTSARHVVNKTHNATTLPTPKISLVVPFHRKHKSLVIDPQKDQSSRGISMLKDQEAQRLNIKERRQQ